MKPVPQWRRWWRRYSTWLALSIPALTTLRDAFPTIQELIPPGTYKMIVGAIGFAIVVAVHIKQNSVSGGKDEL